jgi:hypothetical protein
LQDKEETKRLTEEYRYRPGKEGREDRSSKWVRIQHNLPRRDSVSTRENAGCVTLWFG